MHSAQSCKQRKYLSEFINGGSITFTVTDVVALLIRLGGGGDYEPLFDGLSDSRGHCRMLVVRALKRSE